MLHLLSPSVPDHECCSRNSMEGQWSSQGWFNCQIHRRSWPSKSTFIHNSWGFMLPWASNMTLSVGSLAFIAIIPYFKNRTQLFISESGTEICDLISLHNIHLSHPPPFYLINWLDFQMLYFPSAFTMFQITQQLLFTFLFSRSQQPLTKIINII